MTYTEHTSCSLPHKPRSPHSPDLPPLLRARGGKVDRRDTLRETIRKKSRTIMQKVTYQLQKIKIKINPVIKNSVTLFTFSTLQLYAHSVWHVVRRVALQAVVGAGADMTVFWTGLTGALSGVIEGLRTGVQTCAHMQVTLHPELIWREKYIQTQSRFTLLFERLIRGLGVCIYFFVTDSHKMMSNEPSNDEHHFQMKSCKTQTLKAVTVL